METQKAWIEDAAAFDSAEQLLQFNSGVLEETPEVKDFLTNNNKFIIVAPKGYGKTLLIKSKRTIMQNGFPGMICLPINQFLDRPIGNPPILPHDRVKSHLGDYNYWHQAWLVAIMLCVAKAAHQHEAISIKFTLESEFSSRLLGAPGQNTASDVLHDLLYLQPGEFTKVVKDINLLKQAYRDVRRRVCLFIDNIDEYLDPYVEKQASKAGDHRFMYRHADTKIWVLGQITVARAIRDLAGLNPHIKVFAAIRKEAYIHLDEYDTTAPNIRACSVDLEYDKTALARIFEKNISIEQPEKLASPNAKDPIARFAGTNNTRVENVFTGKNEQLLDFILRHTLSRPRDLMTIGGRLSKIDRKARTQDKIKKTVYSAASETIREYLLGMRGFVEVPDDILFRAIKSNVLTLRDVKRISRQYEEKLHPGTVWDEDDVETGPFCALYRLGLLGVARLDKDNLTDVQFFRRPHEIGIDAHDNRLPKTDRYLIHPSLDDFIVERDGDAYLKNFHRHNVVGHAYPWVEGRIFKFAVKGDLKRYSRLMARPIIGEEFQVFLRDEFEKSRRTVEYASLAEGDSVVFVDSSATKVIRAAQTLERAMRRFQEPQEFRFGGAHGAISFLEDEEPSEKSPSVADVIRSAARIEPLATPGTLLCTEDFVKDKDLSSELRNRFTPVLPGMLPGLIQDADGYFTIVKNPADEPIKAKLFTIRL